LVSGKINVYKVGNQKPVLKVSFYTYINITLYSSKI